MITKKTSYGLKGLLNLAEKKSRGPVLVKEVSIQENIPRSFLNKIFQNLKKAGILESRRGAGGGFQLARSPKRINVREIIEALEGKRSLVRKANVGGTLNDPTSSLLNKARAKVEKMFEGTTLYDLVRRKK